MNNLLAAATLDENLQGIITKLQSLMGQFLDLYRYGTRGGGRDLGRIRRNQNRNRTQKRREN